MVRLVRSEDCSMREQHCRVGMLARNLIQPIAVPTSNHCAGMAGLSCGYHLQKAGVGFAILESAEGVGGRVQTDEVDGFLLDRGFQIFLTSYQEAQALLDYQSLDLKPFYAGVYSHSRHFWRPMQRAWSQQAINIAMHSAVFF